MKRLRLYSTILVLGLGAAMGVRYWTPEKAAAPHRINTQSLAPLTGIGADTTTAPAIASTAANPARQPAIAAPATPPTVTLPDTPLLRSATQAPPIDTAVPAAPRDDLYVAPPRSYDRPAVTAAPAVPARPAALPPSTVPAALSVARPEAIPAPMPTGLRAYEPAEPPPLAAPRPASLSSPASDERELNAAADGAEIQVRPATEPRRQVRRNSARTNAGAKASPAPRQSAGTPSRRVESLFVNPLGVR